MGMFDTVRFRCPNCPEGMVDVQSKGGPCSLYEYEFGTEYIEPGVLAGLDDGFDWDCDSCGKKFIVESEITVKLVPYEEEDNSDVGENEKE